MSAIIPQVIVHNTPNVSAVSADASLITTGGSVSLTGVSYSQILNSLGTDVYNAFLIYLQCQNSAQLTTPISYFIYDVNGNQSFNTLTPTTDPYQFVGSIFFSPSKGNVVFNGNSGLSMTILPYTSIVVKFYAIRVSNQGDGHAVNFMALESKQNVPFFLDYKTNL